MHRENDNIEDNGGVVSISNCMMHLLRMPNENQSQFGILKNHPIIWEFSSKYVNYEIKY